VSHLLTFAARVWRDGGDAVRGELLVAFEPRDHSQGGPPHALAKSPVARGAWACSRAECPLVSLLLVSPCRRTALRIRVCSATLTATVPRATRIWRVDVVTLLFQACAGGLPRERPAELSNACSSAPGHTLAGPWLCGVTLARASDRALTHSLVETHLTAVFEPPERTD